MTLEMGKRISGARGEVEFSARNLAYYAANARWHRAAVHDRVREAVDRCGSAIAHPRIKGVALTGSVAAGDSIAAQAGKAPKISLMELVGSDAFIVLDDADLDHTIPWAVWGRMSDDGQTCCAAKRFIVAEGLADTFLATFQAALTVLEPGDPMDDATTLGPLSTESALVFRVKDDDAAIALANDSDFGLGGSVWTTDVARGERVASRVETGMMFVNYIDWFDAELPFGGIKNSGYGRELGDMGIQEFVNEKLVRVVSMEAPA